jgi:hypothetical protein
MSSPQTERPTFGQPRGAQQYPPAGMLQASLGPEKPLTIYGLIDRSLAVVPTADE